MARRSSLVFSSLVVVTALLMAGCDAGFVTEAARSSLASFATDIASTIINATIAP